MNYKRNEDGQYETDLEMDLSDSNVMKFVHYNGRKKMIVATYNIKTGTLTFRKALDNYLVDEKMIETIKMAMMSLMEFNNEVQH